MHKLVTISLLLLLLAVCSCKDSATYHQYKEVNGVWHKDSVITFKVKKLDTINTYDVFLTLRNDNSYAFSNLFLTTTMQFPNGRTIADTLEYNMAKPDGSWLGTGFGDIKENKLWYKQGVQFDESGAYTFSVRQVMRRNGEVNPITVLEGIRDVGLRIEKSNIN